MRHRNGKEAREPRERDGRQCVSGVGRRQGNPEKEMSGSEQSRG